MNRGFNGRNLRLTAWPLSRGAKSETSANPRELEAQAPRGREIRSSSRETQVIGRDFSGSIPLCSVRCFVAAIGGSERYWFAARAVPHAHGLHDFFASSSNSSGNFAGEETSRLQHDCIARARRTNSIIVPPANGFSRRPSAPLACTRLRMDCWGNAVMKMVGMRVPCAIKQS